MMQGESRRAEILLLAIFGIVLPFILGSSLLIFNDGDVRWHIAAGQWILDHGALPVADPFSFTFPGAKWVTFEWMSQLLYGAAYRLAGFGGVAALASAAIVALHLIVVAQGRRHVGPWGIAATVVLMDLALIPMMLARPHLLAWPLLAGWIAILLRARDADTAPPLAAALLVVPWANLHGSWALGIVIAGFVALDHCLERRWHWPVVRAWLLFGILATAGAMITPNGLDGFVHPLTVSKLETLPLIVEWRPSDPARTPFFFVALAATILILLWRGFRIRPLIAFLLLVLLAMALHQMRHQAMLAIAAAMIVPRSLIRESLRPPLFAGSERRLAIGGTAFAIAALALFRAANPLEPAENGANPRSAIAAIPADLRDKPMLNGYGFGGPMIFQGMKVFIDGRSDFYGDAFMIAYQRMVDGDRAALGDAITRYDLGWSILPPRYDKLIANLDRDPRWIRIHSDPVAIIHRRIDIPSASGSPRAIP
ncbi:hypothetical protein G7076_07375 [Sphingomonas sp. HDW15A]|uniref:hypothetical protein n=1 Tax=Sphingomonas sp. HDW15A TaxID=2714942 RepID=UPI0014080707|nr:hypothetical protein [Sphingomonas sp. HDW15A]QIK96290.1 hypothetical protein G7076_07375 [Sphingomonas sp. HDW15A]